MLSDRPVQISQVVQHEYQTHKTGFCLIPDSGVLTKSGFLIPVSNDEAVICSIDYLRYLIILFIHLISEGLIIDL